MVLRTFCTISWENHPSKAKLQFIFLLASTDHAKLLPQLICPSTPKFLCFFHNTLRDVIEPYHWSSEAIKFVWHTDCDTLDELKGQQDDDLWQKR